DWDAYRGAGHASQGGLLQSRRAAQRQAQAGVRAALSARGAADVEDFATVNHLRATITPELASELLELPEVGDLQLAEKAQPLAAYTGFESQSGTQLDAFFNAGFAGATGHTTTAPVRLAIIESNSGSVFNSGHVGWRNGSGVSRIASTRNCGIAGCPFTAT